MELSLAGKRVSRTVRGGEAVTLATEPMQAGAAAEIAWTARGVDAETGVRWSRLRYAAGDEERPIPLGLSTDG